jgi:D-3-phosphoglycerate dehydrogenase
MKQKILVCTSTFGESDKTPLNLLKKNFAVIVNQYRRTLTEDEVIFLGRGCTGIISGSEHISEKVLDALPDINCISRVGIGLDNIDLDAARKRNISIKNTPDAPTRAVAELTVGLILDLLRGISIHDHELRHGIWNKKLGDLLQNKKIGIIGLGRIGRLVAELLLCLGAKVCGTDINPDTNWAQKHDVSLKEFSELLLECDIVTIHIPFSKENASPIGNAEIMKMKKGSFLLNLSRGGIVDEVALYQALKSGHLAGAAVDTFATEPYHGPLIDLKNVILTPHIGSYTRESRSAMELEAVHNLITMMRGAKDII